MNDLEEDFDGERFYTIPIHNIVGIKTFLTTLTESTTEEQQTPCLRRALCMVNATTLQT